MTHPALDAVAALIRAQTMRIEYDGIPGLTYRVKAPSLLAQLAAAVGVGMEAGGVRGVPGSRPTINADVLDLWTELVTATAAWCAALGVDRAPLRVAPASQVPARDPAPRALAQRRRALDLQLFDLQAADLVREMPAGRRDYVRGRPVNLDATDTPDDTPAIGRLLRSCAANAISRGWTEIADRIRTSAHAWAGRIETMLGARPGQRRVRRASCPSCAATSVIEDRDGTDYRVPALALVEYEQGGQVLLWLVCSACGWFAQVTGDAFEDPWGWWRHVTVTSGEDQAA